MKACVFNKIVLDRLLIQIIACDNTRDGNKTPPLGGWGALLHP
jgi:hypothetical protein